MSLLIFLYCATFFILCVIIISGFVLLIKHIHYAYSDACVLFANAYSMRGIISFDKNYVMVHPSKPEGEAFGLMKTFNYNVFLNVIRQFPLENRLRYVQSFNLILYLLYMLVTFFLLLNILTFHDLEYSLAIFNSLLFMLLIGARTKIMSVAITPLSDIINYLLFMISVCLASSLANTPSQIAGFALGFVVGLAYRNRFSDIILILTGLIFLFYLNADWWIKTVYSSGVLLANIDAIWLMVSGKENPFYWIVSIWRANVNIKSSGNSGGIIYSFISAIVSGMRIMFNFYADGSFWASMGSSVLICPLSVVYILNEGLLNDVHIFLFIYTCLFCFVTLFIRRNQLDGVTARAYFSDRQVYILFPILIIFNTMAFSFICLNGHSLLMIIYIIWIFFYIIHQGYKILSYYFLENLRETADLDYRKKNFPYMHEIADFIKGVKKPVVVMGYGLYNDEAHDFYTWSKDVRSVNVRLRIDDKRALDIIRKYNVTHVIISPISYFVGEQCSLGKKF